MSALRAVPRRHRGVRRAAGEAHLDPEAGERRVRQQVAIEGVEHHRRVDAVEHAGFEQRILPPPPSSAGVPISSTCPPSSAADPGQRQERAHGAGRDQVVAAGVADLGQRVVLGEDRDPRPGRAGRRARETPWADRPMPRSTGTPPRSFDELADPLRCLVLVEAELRVLMNVPGERRRAHPAIRRRRGRVERVRSPSRTRIAEMATRRATSPRRTRKNTCGSAYHRARTAAFARLPAIAPRIPTRLPSASTPPSGFVAPSPAQALSKRSSSSKKPWARASTSSRTPTRASTPTATKRALDRAYQRDAAPGEIAQRMAARQRSRRASTSSAGSPVAVGTDTFAVIEKSVWAGALSKGSFDITFQSMSELWKFGDAAEDKPRVPSAAEVAARRKLVDYRKLELDPDEPLGQRCRRACRSGSAASPRATSSTARRAVLRATGLDGLLGSGRRRSVRRRAKARRLAVGERHPGSTRGARSLLRDARARESRVLDRRRLRALVHRRTASATITSSIRAPAIPQRGRAASRCGRPTRSPADAIDDASSSWARKRA